MKTTTDVINELCAIKRQLIEIEQEREHLHYRHEHWDSIKKSLDALVGEMVSHMVMQGAQVSLRYVEALDGMDVTA
jgi:hypothetical protein